MNKFLNIVVLGVITGISVAITKEIINSLKLFLMERKMLGQSKSLRDVLKEAIDKEEKKKKKRENGEENENKEIKYYKNKDEEENEIKYYKDVRFYNG